MKKATKTSKARSSKAKVEYTPDTFQTFRSANLTKDGTKLIVASEDGIAISVNVGLIEWIFAKKKKAS